MKGGRQSERIADPVIGRAVERIDANMALLAVPVGTVVSWVGRDDRIPTSWLPLDGRLLPIAEYAELFDILGTLYGGDASSGSFKLPDMRGRYLFHRDASGTGDATGETFGTKDHTHSIAAHTHTVPAHTHGLPGHTHSVPAHYHGMGTGADLNITSSGNHSHTVTYQTGLGAVTEPAGTTTGNSIGAQPTSGASHEHVSAAFAGRIGLVTGGVDGNSAMTSGSTSGTSDSGGSGTSGSGGSGTTGTANPPSLTGLYIIKVK